MCNHNRIVVAGLVCLGLNVVACSAERDVEVSGTVSAPSSVMVSDAVLLDFFDEEQDTEGVKTKGKLKLGKLGAFQKTVALEGEHVLVRAIDDRDGNGKCTEGEAWGQAKAGIEGDAAAMSITLALEPCPYLGP
jgi:hypothetical protein